MVDENTLQASGSVYVLSNAAMEGYIKIGRTEEGTVRSVVQRMNSLNSSGLPLPFDCEHASAVADAQATERALHEAFGDYRVRPEREFFRDLAPFRVTAILRLFEIEDVTPPSRETDTTETGSIREPRRPKFRFDAVDISSGALIQWADDTSIECEVDSDRTTYVLFEGQRIAISTLARDLKGWNRTPSGLTYWLYEGETLYDRRLRMENEEGEQGRAKPP